MIDTILHNQADKYKIDLSEIWIWSHDDTDITIEMTSTWGFFNKSWEANKLASNLHS